MENFSLSYEWRQEKNQFYVLSTEGTEDSQAVELNITYRDKANLYNQAQWDYNNRASVENNDKLLIAQEDYVLARRNLIDFIKNKNVDGVLRYPDFIDPDA